MKQSSFFRQLGMDLVRSICSIRFVVLVLIFTLLLMAGGIRDLERVINWQMSKSVIKALFLDMNQDRFKVILVLALSGIYTKSFCDDYNSHYLRCVLNRADVVYYAQSRVLINALANVLGSVLGFAVATMFYSIFMPLITDADSLYHLEYAQKHPLFYILLIGLVFGLVTAACSSIGLLVSSFQPNPFVSIALAGLIFYLAVSYLPDRSIFDFLGVVVLAPLITKSENGQLADILWCILYPVLIIYISGLIFRKKLEWRVKNGYI